MRMWISGQLTAIKCAVVSSIVTEANHGDAVCLFRHDCLVMHDFHGLKTMTFKHIADIAYF